MVEQRIYFVTLSTIHNSEKRYPSNRTVHYKCVCQMQCPSNCFLQAYLSSYWLTSPSDRPIWATSPLFVKKLLYFWGCKSVCLLAPLSAVKLCRLIILIPISLFGVACFMMFALNVWVFLLRQDRRPTWCHFLAGTFFSDTTQFNSSRPVMCIVVLS